MSDNRLPIDPYRRLPPAESLQVAVAIPEAGDIPVVPESPAKAETSAGWWGGNDGLTLGTLVNEKGERVTLRWREPTPGHARTIRRRNQQQGEAARELGKLWCSPYGPTAGEAMLEYTRNLGWDRMGEVYDAVHPLPWSVLRPLAALRAWAVWPGGVSSPLTTWPSDAEKRIRQLPGELERWRRLDRLLGRAWGTFYDIFQRAATMAEPGKPDRFLGEIGDALEIAQKTTAERLFHLEDWAAGTRLGRLTGSGKSDGKAQNLVRLRTVTIELARRINRAIPRRRSDGRVLHGVLRVRVIRRTISIITAVYGVVFSEAEMKDMLHKSLKERQKPAR